MKYSVGMTKTTWTVAVCGALLWAGTAIAWFGPPRTPVPPTPTPTPTIIPALATCTSKLNTCLAAASMKPRFIDNGDGTVTDTTTALMWEKKTTDGSVHNVGNAYTWSSSGTAADGTAFTEFLAKLNDAAGGGTHCFAGYCDWRLPKSGGIPSVDPSGDPAELETILGYTQGQCGGGTGPCVFPALGPTQANNGYWSSSSVDINAWVVAFSNGSVFRLGKGGLGTYVRAVRSGS